MSNKEREEIFDFPIIAKKKARNFDMLTTDMKNLISLDYVIFSVTFERVLDVLLQPY